MTILSLTLFRRREEPYRTYREDASTRGDKVLNRLQQMLVVDTVSREQIEENEVNEKTRSDAGADLAAANPRGDDPGDTSAAPELTASNVVSAVAFLTPADEIEVERLSVPAPIDEDTAEALASLGLESAAPNTTKWTQEDEDTDNRVTITLDEAHAEAIARQLVEQERDRLREDTRRQVERRHARECADGLARRAGPRPDRYKKRSARPNTIGLTSRPRGSRGPRRRRPGMSPPSCVWTKPAAPPICFGGTAGHRAARASTTTPPAGAGTPARFSPRCGSRG